MRPDKCGIVFEKLSDRIFFGTVFKDPTKEAVGQVDAFVEQGFSVFLVSNTQQFPLTAQIAAGHDEAEVRAEFSGHVEARR